MRASLAYESGSMKPNTPARWGALKVAGLWRVSCIGPEDEGTVALPGATGRSPPARNCPLWCPRLRAPARDRSVKARDLAPTGACCGLSLLTEVAPELVVINGRLSRAHACQRPGAADRKGESALAPGVPAAWRPVLKTYRNSSRPELDRPVAAAHRMSCAG